MNDFAKPAEPPVLVYAVSWGAKMHEAAYESTMSFAPSPFVASVNALKVIKAFCL